MSKDWSKYCLSAYKEFNLSLDEFAIDGEILTVDFPSIADNISENPMPKKDFILNYLKRGKRLLCL